MKTYFVLAGNHREYFLKCLELAEQIEVKEGGPFKVLLKSGPSRVFFSEHWQMRYLSSEWDLRGAKNYQILNIGSWRSRKDLAVIQALYKAAVAFGDAT